MNLVLDSRYLSFALRISDARKAVDDEDEEIDILDLTGGQFEPAPQFGFQFDEEEDEE